MRISCPHVEKAFLELCLARLPRTSAELVQAACPRHPSRNATADRCFRPEEELAVSGIVDLETVVRRARGFDGLQSGEPADAMVGMDDDVAGIQSAGFSDDVRALPPTLRATDEAIAQNVLLGHH